MKLQMIFMAALPLAYAVSSPSNSCNVDTGTNYTQNTILDCQGGTCGDMECMADPYTCSQLPGPCVLFAPDNTKISNCTHGLTGEGFYVPNSCSVKCTGCVPRTSTGSDSNSDNRRPNSSSSSDDWTRKLLLRGGAPSD